MKSNDSNSLHELLTSWQEQAETPPDFRREVWRRIAAEAHDPGWVERLAWWLLRPKREGVVLALVIVLAVVWGITHPPEEINPHDAYVMSISPFDPSHLRDR